MCLKRITQQFFVPDIDLFAFRLNYRVKLYISWRPDPGAVCTDAFTCDWVSYRFYVFTPFSLIDRTVQTNTQDKARGLLVVPDWKTQLWYPAITKMCAENPRLILAQKHLLVLPCAIDKIHPLHQKLNLLVCHISGPIQMSEFIRKCRFYKNEFLAKTKKQYHTNIKK